MEPNPILLIFPGNIERKPTLPLSILTIASYLRKYNVPVEILDTRIKDYKNINFNNYELIGISAKSGEQVSSAIKICEHIKNTAIIQIAWGGVHATLFPEQTLKSELVDYVIVGEGEQTFLELCQKKKLSEIEGLVHSSKGKIVFNKPREFLDMNSLDIPAYDLVDINNYQDSLQYFTLETSRGCPHRCFFCYINSFHKNRWRSKSVEKVIGEIKKTILQYNIKRFAFCDDNAFVDKKRILGICERIIEEKFDIELFMNSRVDYFAGYSSEELETLKCAGLKFIGFGAESGSQRILDSIHKDITYEDIIVSARKCAEHGLIPVYSFIIGTPKETKEDLDKTINLYFELKRISKTIEISGFFLFTPYPGTEFYSQLIKEGYKTPQTLEAWADWNFSDTSNLAWLSKSKRKRLQVLSKIILFHCLKDRLVSYGDSFKKEKLNRFERVLWSVGSFILTSDANLRFKRRKFGFGYEWLLFGYISLRWFKVT